MSIDTTTFCDGCHASLAELGARGHLDGCTINGRHSHLAALPLDQCYYYRERLGMDHRQGVRTDTMIINAESLSELLASRERWWRVDVVPGQHHKDGRGWDVVLRLDGSYGDREQAEEVRQHFIDRLSG